jgi:hypothetical protein
LNPCSTLPIPRGRDVNVFFPTFFFNFFFSQRVFQPQGQRRLQSSQPFQESCCVQHGRFECHECLCHDPPFSPADVALQMSLCRCRCEDMTNFFHMACGHMRRKTDGVPHTVLGSSH